MRYSIVLLVLIAMLVGWVTPTNAAEPTTAPSSVAIVALHGPVDDYNRDALFRRFEQAKKLGAKTIIIDLDTYGGLVTAGLDISRFLKRQDDVHTIAYVGDKAISAGAMIALACNEIVMGSSAVIGDCALIMVNSTEGGMQPLPDAERAKQESPILNDFENSAHRNGYDPKLVTAMVAVERTIYWVQNAAGEKRFVDDAEYQTLKTEGWSTVPGAPSPVDGPKTLLTVQTDLARQLGLASGVASSAEALATARGYSVVANLTPGTGEAMIALLGSATVRFILLTIFLQSLYIALHTPGQGAAEAVATISLGLLVGVPLLTGFAQWWEVLAIFVGLALLAFEIFVFPGHGVSAILGIILMLGGFLMTFVGKEPSGLPGFLPSLGATWAGLRQGLFVLTGGLTSSLFLSLWLRRYLPAMPFFKELILTTTSGETTVANDARQTSAPTDFPSLAVGGVKWGVPSPNLNPVDQPRFTIRKFPANEPSRLSATAASWFPEPSSSSVNAAATEY